MQRNRPFIRITPNLILVYGSRLKTALVKVQIFKALTIRPGTVRYIVSSVQISRCVAGDLPVTRMTAAQEASLLYSPRLAPSKIRPARPLLTLLRPFISVKPDQQCQHIFARLQIGGNIYPVRITAARQALTEKAALVDRQPAVYIQPVFCINRYQKAPPVPVPLLPKTFAKGYPVVFLVIVVRPNPISMK